MILIDNNLTLDNETHDEMERHLEEVLATYNYRQYFTIQQLYRKLELKLTPGRTGSVDKLIDGLLKDWQWYKRVQYRNPDKYTRERYKPTKRMLEFASGGSVEHVGTWPKYGWSRPPKRDGAGLEKIAQKLRQNIARPNLKGQSSQRTQTLCYESVT